MKIALCCIAKNEDQYCEEWILYYRKLGFDKIFLYENDWKCPVSYYPFLKKIQWAGKFQQRHCYMDFAINRSAGFDWVAYFDLDEYLVLKKHENIHDFVKWFDQLNPVANGMAINLQTYGANGQKERGEHHHSLLKQFTRRQGGISPYVKLIVKLPVSGTMIDPHMWTVTMTDERGNQVFSSLNYSGSCEMAVINHYAVKSFEDWKIRCNRGYPFSPNKVSKYQEWENLKNNDSEYEDLTAKNFMYGED